MNIKAILGIMRAYFLWKMTTHPPKVWKILYLFFTLSLAHNEKADNTGNVSRYDTLKLIQHVFFSYILNTFYDT